MRKADILCETCQPAFSAATKITVVKSFSLISMRFQQYPFGAFGGATGQMQSHMALYINNFRLYFLITFPSLFKRRLPF